MKTFGTIFLAFIVLCAANSQENIDDLLAAGISDAQRFSSDYLAPATQGVAYAMTNGWFNHGKAVRGQKFEFSIIGNISFIQDEKKSFLMNISDYENVRFEDNSPSKTVATALGQNDPDIRIIITYDDPVFGNQEVEITLPTGIGSANLNLIPTAFLQASVAPFKGTRFIGRFFPKINTEDTQIGLYGLGLQHEITAWLPADKHIPVAVSGLIAFTHLDASYDFTDSTIVEGDNQRVETDINTYLFELVASTNLKIINFYAGLGYISGNSTADVLGTYRVSDGLIVSEDIVDPYSVEQKISGMRTTVGANLKLGFFGLNVDYTVAEFDSASFGINFSF
jgi:hypothetical protein